MDDCEIVALFWNRDERAIEETATKYGQYCFTIAYHFLKNKQDAEECVNDTYQGAWSSIPPNKPAVLSTYLGKITRRLSLKILRSKDTDKRGRGEVALSLDELSGCIPASETIEARIEFQELIAPAVDIWGTSDGTSYAAPQVTGTIAQLCGLNATLKIKQSAMGAILAASAAEKVEATGDGGKGDTFLSSVRINAQISDKEGAGILDSRWARGIVANGNFWSHTINADSFPFEKLKHFHGYSSKEVANMLGLSEANVIKLDQRAKKQLRILCQKEGLL